MFLIDSTIKFFLDNSINDGASMFFQRQLEQILARTFEVQYADLKHRELFPVSNEVNEGAITLTYHVMDRVGIAKFIGALVKDLPRADAFAIEVKSPLKTAGISFGYNTDEIRAARFVGVPLEQRKANAARRGMEERFNTTAFIGDADTGLPGFLTNANITVTTVVNGATSGTTFWAGKTPDEILFDVNDLFGDIFTVSLMKERANTLLLPPDKWNLIATTPRSANSDMSILKWIVANSPFLNSENDIIPVNEMTAAGAGGLDRMAAYTRNPDKLANHIPMEQKFLPVQQKGLEFIIPSEGKTGGVVVYFPLSAAFADGI